eukprot:13874815-Ditylum_brightwellii.AAC.1
MAEGSTENEPSPCELQRHSTRRTLTPLGRCCKCTTMSRCLTSRCECRRAGRECVSCSARNCCNKQNNGSASLNGNEANGRHSRSRT